MAKYSESSPWKDTREISGQYLGILSIRPVPSESDDIEYEIGPQYTYRPDLLAYDLYDDRNLWWVFAQRNMDVLKDPVYDFIAGTKIYLPKKSNLITEFGV